MIVQVFATQDFHLTIPVGENMLVGLLSKLELKAEKSEVLIMA